MNRFRPLLVLTILTGGLLATAFKTVNYLDGDAVMAKVKETHSTDAEVDIVKMVSVSGTNDPVTLTILSAVQKDPKGNFMYMLRVLSPDDKKGTSLLVLEKDGGDVQQFIYLPSFGVKEIKAEGRSGSFMNSDFTYEDMRREKPGEWTYARLEDEKVGDTDCYVIISDPADKEREKITGYTDRVLYVDKATYDIRRIEFLDSKHKLIKVFDAYDYESSNGATQQRPRRGEMTNPSKKTNTVMSLLASRINQPLDPKFFSLDTVQHWGPDQDKIVQDLLPGTAAGK
ncbi:MAG TPA: outer membrane lipoprotein-sorting protein [Opitutales bacterium]|nr:outer membrane lipoprotein-sorting protein [Opitutales bacterium]